MWKKIREVNEGEYLTYFVDDKKLDAGKYMVRWPDGKHSNVDIIFIPYTKRVYDMGHEYDCYGAKASIRVMFHGLPIIIPAAGLDVWIEK